MDSSSGDLDWAEEGPGSYKLGVEFEDAESGFWGDDYSLQSK